MKQTYRQAQEKLVVADSIGLLHTCNPLAPGGTLQQVPTERQPFSHSNCGIFPLGHTGATQAVSNGLFIVVFSPLSAALVGARIDDANVECRPCSGFYNAEKRLAQSGKSGHSVEFRFVIIPAVTSAQLPVNLPL